jgi:DNA-binding NarL/FixJ family response regulator
MLIAFSAAHPHWSKVMFTTLLVEDNPTFRKSLKEMLSGRFPAMKLQEAGNGEEALQKVDEGPPDLIFMDIKLPGANGLDLTKRIKAVHQNIVVIVLTSYDIPEYREAAMKCGANFFFTKGSTSSDELSSVVRSVLTTSHNRNGGPSTVPS